MKILTITDNFPPESLGGAGQVALDLSLGLKSAGHDVSVLATTQKKENQGVNNFHGLRVTRLYFDYPTKFLRSYLALFNPFLELKVKRIIKKEKPDIIHFHNIHQFFSFSAIDWAKSSGAKLFMTAHDTGAFSYTRLDHFIKIGDPEIPKVESYKMPLKVLVRQSGKSFNPLRNVFVRRLMNKNLRKVFSVSEALKKALTDNGIKNVQTIYNGIDIDYFHNYDSHIADHIRSRLNLEGKKIIFFGGRSMIDKGTEDLISTFRLVLNKFPRAYLVMALESNHHAEHLKNITKDLQEKENIIFPGLFKGDELAAMFNISDIVAVPSIYFDPAPLMAMQAMAAGKPVIGTCFGGMPEIVIDGKTGFIINPYDKNNFADKFIYLFENDDQVKSMGLAGYERAKEKFNIQRQVEETIKEYAEN